MRTILVPEVGDRVTLASTVEAEPSVVVIWVVGHDVACRFGYRTAGGEVGSALSSAIACYGSRWPGFPPEDCQGCGAPIKHGAGGLCGACAAQDAPDYAGGAS